MVAAYVNNEESLDPHARKCASRCALCLGVLLCAALVLALVGLGMNKSMITLAGVWCMSGVAILAYLGKCVVKCMETTSTQPGMLTSV